MLIVAVVLGVIATAALVTSMVCTVELSDNFLIKILPVPFAIGSLKTICKEVPVEMLVALSGGVRVVIVGGVRSAPPVPVAIIEKLSIASPWLLELPPLPM